MTQGIRIKGHIRHPGFTLNLDLQLPGQGICAISGPSGAGKTSLLRAIAGFIPLQDGELWVNGQCWQRQQPRIWRAPHQRAIGYVFQEVSLFEHLSALDNLKYGFKRVPRQERRLSLQQIIDWLDLAPLLTRMPEQLSGGERQRVGIGRALAVSPQLLLLDEPLAALDQAARQSILPYLERLQAELQLPMLYVSHAADEIARLADHVLLLDKGQVQASAPLHELLARADLPPALCEQAATVLEAQVTGRDPEWHLLQVELAGGALLWLPDNGQPLGSRLRIRLLAQDIVLTTTAQPSNLLNQLEVCVQALSTSHHPSLLRVQLNLGPNLLWAQISKRSAAVLQLSPGQRLWAQILSAQLVHANGAL
jgi:molybdate transport system ATP-binding protein